MGTERENFKNRLGVLFAMAGSAIGLGNIWRFPYVTAQNGGAAFILVYLILMTLICLPVLISETLLGRRSASNAISAYGKLVPEAGKAWGKIGYFGVMAAMCVLSFYCVVGGWSVRYLIDAVTFQITSFDGNYAERFGSYIGSPLPPVLYAMSFLAITGAVIVMGVKNGIERMSKIMMSVLLVIIVLVAIRSMTLPGAMEGVKYMLVPDFSKIDGNVVLAALGQAFFSMSIGCGTILTYGSYVKKSENLVTTSILTSAMDVLFAIIAGLAIIPAVFAIASMNGYEPVVDAGPSLVYITLPGVFKAMPMGAVFAILFFLALLLAAVTSSISMMESMVAFLTEEFRMKRSVSVILCIVLCGTVGCFCSLSQGAMANLKLFGLNIFDFFDYISSNILMVCGGFFMMIFAGWRMKKSDYMDELTNGGTLHIPAWFARTLYFLVRYLAPLGILAIFLANLLL